MMIFVVFFKLIWYNLFDLRTKGGNLRVTHVAVRNGNLDGALRKFKQKVARDGIPSEFKKREAYDKPGVKRREAKKAGIKNARKREKRNRD